MNKILKIVIIIVAIVATIGFGIFAIIYSGIIYSSEEKAVVTINTNEEGKTFTTREWVWQPAEEDGLISYLPDSDNIETQTITLCLQGNNYVDIEIPSNIEYISDYGKTVYAEDGSFLIRVIQDTTLTNLSTKAGITDSQSLSKICVASKEDKEGTKTIATLLDNDNGYAILVNIYSGNEAYTVIRNSILQASTYEKKDIKFSNDLKQLDTLDYSGNFTNQIIVNDINLSQIQYLFAEGQLYQQSVVEPMSKIYEQYLITLNTLSNSEISTIYESSGVVYAEAGGYYLGLFAYNSNTTIVFIGSGEESKCNIISLLHLLL